MTTAETLRRVPWTCRWGRFGESAAPKWPTLRSRFVFWTCARPRTTACYLTRGSCEDCPHWEPTSSHELNHVILESSNPGSWLSRRPPSNRFKLPHLCLEPRRLGKQNVVLEMHVFVKIAFERFELLQAHAIGRARTVRDGIVRGQGTNPRHRVAG